MSIFALEPHRMAMLACTAYGTQQSTFYMYHYNSHAANPIMLRSPKPQVMRDFFLVPCNLSVATEWWRLLNPLPGVYVFALDDMVWNCVTMAVVGAPLIKTIGMGHVSAVYALGAIFSGFAYVFQMQCSRTKKSTDFDCAASSQGSLSAICALSLLMPNQRVPWARRVPSSIFAAAYIARSLYEEYGLNPFAAAEYHKWFRTSDLARKFQSGGENVTPNDTLECAMSDLEGAYFRGSAATTAADAAWAQSAASSGHIELTNWGSIGGILVGLIYGSLVIGVKKDFSKMGRFWSRMPSTRGGKKAPRAPPPSWGSAN